ncbi:MAG: DUF3549 family protein [Aestuariibacter sp.]
MQTISSISEFLLEAHTEYRIFDMGRTIREINAQSFLEIENGSEPAPYPRQQMFWVGLLFWNKSLSTQQYIWFLKLPLDENGCVVCAHRDQFLHIIVDALGKEFIEEHKEAKLPDNPYQFAPPQQQMADFNAIAKKTLSLPLSSDAEKARLYLAAPTPDGWQTLSIQGLSDACVTLQKTTLNGLTQYWQDYPIEVQRSIGASLENIALPESFRATLSAKLLKSDFHSEQALLLLRAISRDNDDVQLRTYVTKQLNENESVSQDLLIVLAGRFWHWCSHEAFLLAFLEKCAREDCFAALYPDLVQIPGIRSHLLAVLRNTQRSAELGKAIGALFQR